MCGFIAHLVEHRTGIAEVTGSNPVEALIFFTLLLSNCLNWKIYCHDHSSLSLLPELYSTRSNYYYLFVSYGLNGPAFSTFFTWGFFAKREHVFVSFGAMFVRGIHVLGMDSYQRGLERQGSAVCLDYSNLQEVE